MELLSIVAVFQSGFSILHLYQYSYIRVPISPHPPSSVQSLSCDRLFATPWTAAHQASLSITNSRSLLKLMSIESVMPSNHPILCRPLLLPPSTFPSIRVFSNELVLRIRWPKYWSFSFSISPSNEHSGLISFRIDLTWHPPNACYFPFKLLWWSKWVWGGISLWFWFAFPEWEMMLNNFLCFCITGKCLNALQSGQKQPSLFERHTTIWKAVTLSTGFAL